MKDGNKTKGKCLLVKYGINYYKLLCYKCSLKYIFSTR